MDKHYQPQSIEKQCYQRWEAAGYFHASLTPDAVADEGKKPSTTAAKAYCIMLPPPNVTGSLHMGHGFQHTLMDALIRYQRMQQKPTLWQPGTDHAGIATQMVVERQLQQHNETRQSLGRDAFIDKVWEWKEHSGNTISNQLRRMGSSLDWSRECFTMDKHFSAAVIDVFVRLYNEGLIYRGHRLVNWDVKFQTALSDLEVENKTQQGTLWYFRYPLDNDTNTTNERPTDWLTIATTRPETMLGDTAVAVHPDDTRYQHLIGKSIRLPISERVIPIIADTQVDADFGSGCVKITPAHDFNDYAMGRRHDLALINILNVDGSLNDNVPQAYRGLDRFAARKKIIADMQALNCFEKEEPHTLNLPMGDRSHEVVEPRLTEQWFVKAKPLAEPAIAAVRHGQIKLIPEGWNKTYFNWLENIEDWCISRQLWWGHRIPAWYDDQGNLYVGHDENSVRKTHQLDDTLKLRQDDDVLDTWFSSALWPFATLGWPEKTAEFERYFPTSVLVTGFDIIFFWVARMVMMSLKFTDTIPFHEVYITGLIRDAHGQKMSKSKGNVLDPIDLIDGISLDDLVAKRTRGLMQPQQAKQIETATRAEFPEGISAHGTDALRFTFCALAGPGRDIRFDVGRLAGYHHFCNKIWNAARYVLQRTEGFDAAQTPDVQSLATSERWILTSLQQTIDTAHQHYQHYRFDLLAQCLYDFTWNEFCDWYLELSKPVLLASSVTTHSQRATQWTLLTVLETLMRLMHPVMPYITETIWQQVKARLGIVGDSIMCAPYPVADAKHSDTESVHAIGWLKQVVVGLRTLRAEMNISPAKHIPVYFAKGTSADRAHARAQQALLTFLAKLEGNITWLDNDATAPGACATVLVNDLEILVPMKGLVDTKAEQSRLSKAIKKLEDEMLKANRKLDNPNYISKAPPEVVAQERERVAQFTEQLSKLREKQTTLAQLDKAVS